MHEEFLLFQEAGLTPYEVLLCTTVNPAKMLGYEDRLGTIERGKDADMVLLNENPLDDIGNTSDIYGVLVKGIWISEEDIQSMLDEVEQAVKKINEEYSDS